MNTYCQYSNNQQCKIWTDYEVLRYEIEDAAELSHENWNELQRKEQYIQTLQKILDDFNIEYPAEL